MAFQAVARPHICIYGVWEARRKEIFHTITDFTFSHVLSGTPNNKCKYLSKFAVFKLSVDNVMRSYFWHYSVVLHKMFVAPLIPLFRFDKVNPSFTSLLYHWLIIAGNYYAKYLSLIWDIAATADSTSWRSFSAHFSNVFYTILNKIRGRAIFDLLG